MSEHDEMTHALLRTEREAPGMPDDVAERLARRFNLPSTPTRPTSATDAPTASNVATTSTNVGSTALVMRAALGAAIFVLGAGAGIYIDRTWLDRTWLDPHVPTPQMAHEAAPITPPREAEAPAVETPPTVTVAVPEVVPPSTPPTPREEENTDTERLWIERAESAFARGETRAALAAIQAHRSHFPRGRMNEERDALEVRVLFHAGDQDEATRHADRFREAYPRSIFLRQIESAHRAAQTRDDSSTESQPTPQTPSNPNSPDPRMQ